MLLADLVATSVAVAATRSRKAKVAALAETLARVEASGRTGLAGRKVLADKVSALAPEFALLDLDLRGLATECEVGDLDLIDRGGALREAADALLAESDDQSRSAEDREIAAAALARLYGYAQERSA